MTEYRTAQGKGANYWYAQYLEEVSLSTARGRKIRDLEAQLGRQKRTIQGLLEEKAQRDAEKPVDEPVVNEGTLTLEQRVNNLEKQAVSYGKVFDAVDATLNALVDRLQKLEKREPVETKVDIKPLIVKGAAMLDVADALNRSFNRAGRKF